MIYSKMGGMSTVNENTESSVLKDIYIYIYLCTSKGPSIVYYVIYFNNNYM